MKTSLLIVTLMALTLVQSAFAEPDHSAAENPAAETSGSSARTWAWSLGLGFSFYSHANFLDVSCDGCFDNPSVDITYTQALRGLVETRWRLPRDQWGWGLNVGLAADTERKADTVKVDGQSTSATDSKLQVTELYVNAIYQFGAMYLPFGLNVDAVKFTPDSNFNGTYSASGGLGTQVGFGYEFNDHWSLEGDLHILSFKLSSTDSSGGKVDYGNGTFSTLVATGRYTF